MMQPKVSIIVPVYNVEQYIDRCMESLLNQTLKEIEIILVDDESPDNCPQICENYAKRDSRIKVVHKLNGGLGYARNSGLEVAIGEYIAFVDSDDFVSLDMCEKLYRKAIDENADIVYGSINLYYGKDHMVPRHYCKGSYVVEGEKEISRFMADLIATQPNNPNDTVVDVSVWKAIFRKKIFDDYNILFKSEREYISEDVVFNLEFIPKARKIVVIEDIVYYYCFNENSLSRTYREDRFDKDVIMYDYIVNDLNNKQLLKTYKSRTERFLMVRARVAISAIYDCRQQLGWRKMLFHSRNIVHNPKLVECMSNYPIKEMSLIHRVYFRLMKYNQVALLLLVTAANNVRKRR